jgi:hypothetical protein
MERADRTPEEGEMLHAFDEEEDARPSPYGIRRGPAARRRRRLKREWHAKYTRGGKRVEGAPSFVTWLLDAGIPRTARRAVKAAAHPKPARRPRAVKPVAAPKPKKQKKGKADE